MIRRQLRRDAGIAPSSASVAWPLNVIVWPTVHSSDADGVSIVATGPVFEAAIVTWSVPVTPLSSVTVKVAVHVPAAYVWVGAAAVECGLPSPNDQSYVIAPSGSLDAVPSRCTTSGAVPVSGDAWATAVGGVFVPIEMTRWIVPPS
jgi:hypothetical protein